MRAVTVGLSVLLAVAALHCYRADAAKLKRQPHQFRPSSKPLMALRNEVHAKGRQGVGREIPMNGGVLSLGAYFLELVVGSGPGMQTYDVIVDTGSSNTAVPAVGCTTCQTTQLYNASASTTSQLLPCGDPYCQNCAPFSVGNATIPDGSTASCPYGRAVCFSGQCGFGFAYGGGGTGTEGTIVTDVACLDGICSTIFLDQLMNEFPTGTQNTGILGLAYSAIACNPTCQPPILDAMVASGAIPAEKDRFGMCITPNNGGFLDFGDLNTTRFAPGSMVFTPIVAEGFYSLEVKDIAIGGISIGVPTLFYKIHNDVLGSFVDSGTSILLVGPYAFSQMQSVILNNFPSLANVNTLFNEQQCANFTGDLAAINQYPDISFLVAGMPGKPDFNLTITGQNYLMASGGGVYCLGIAGVPSIGIIFGDVFMENYYISFDRHRGVLGFAPLTSCN